MSSEEKNMSLDHQIPVIMKKTQMNGDHGGSQCGLTSLVPMSCRGRAAAFARDLHSRLRNLGAEQEGENSWLTRENSTTHRPATTSHIQKELDTYFDFELECESPSSPIDDFETPFQDRPSEDTDPPFYDVDTDLEVNEQPIITQKQINKGRNGFKFSTAFYSESPIKFQPSPRENGHVEKPLYSAITFEDCARQSIDEVDCVTIPKPDLELQRLSVCIPNHSVSLDSDSEFESAKSDPSDVLDDVLVSVKRFENDITDAIEVLSIDEAETQIAEELPNDTQFDEVSENSNASTRTLLTNSVSSDREVLPDAEVDTSLLTAEEDNDKQEEEGEDGEDDRPQRVRRCSSLKTGKTPPGTPGRKKIVRFADVLGLDLADVKTFMDEIPVIPKSAYDDLTGCDVQNSPPARPPLRFGALTLVPLFQLPVDFTDKLEKYNVCLESSRVCDGVHVTICGSVRVRNLDFHKTVHIRYTMNRWKTFTDLQATYVQGSCDGYSDRFQFVLYAPCISNGQRLELAVRFQCKGQQFWDNNSGANYCFDCLALGATVPSLTAPSALHPTLDWHPSFY